MLQCCKLHREEDEEQRREEAVGAVELLVVEHSQHELEEREERVGYGGVAGDVKPKRHVEGPEGGSERGGKGAARATREGSKEAARAVGGGGSHGEAGDGEQEDGREEAEVDQGHGERCEEKVHLSRVRGGGEYY